MVYFDILLLNPSDTNVSSSFTFQPHGARCSPYNAFCSLSILCSFLAMKHTAVCSMYTSSYLSPFRNANLASMWYTYHPSCTARAMSKRTESSLATRANTSS